MSYLMVFLLVSTPARAPYPLLYQTTPVVISEQRVGSVLPQGSQFYSKGSCYQWAVEAVARAAKKNPAMFPPLTKIKVHYECESST